MARDKPRPQDRSAIYSEFSDEFSLLHPTRLSKICATNLAILTLSSKEDQTGYPASKAVSARAGLTFANTPLAPEFLGTKKNYLTGVEALLLLATCRKFRFPKPSKVDHQMATAICSFFSSPALKDDLNQNTRRSHSWQQAL